MFKDQLKKLRIEKHMTQEELAKKIFVTRSAVAKWEQGRGLPQDETLNRLAELFQVSKEQLMLNEEPVQMIEKMDQTRKKYGVVILTFLLIFIISVVSAILYVNKKENQYTLRKNQFYQEKTLEKYKLSSLNPVPTDGSDSYLTVVDYKENTFYGNVKSIEDADNYAAYVFNYLLNNEDILYVGYGIRPRNENMKYYYLKTYIKPSSSLQNFLVENVSVETETGISHDYNFYYVTKGNASHKKKDKMKFYLISISYRNNFYDIKHGLILNNKYLYFNFDMTITTVGNNQNSYYLYDDFYRLDKIAINQDNFNEYFTISASLTYSSDAKKKYRVTVLQKTWEEYLEEYDNYYLICDFSIFVKAGKDNNVTKEIRIPREDVFGYAYFEEIESKTNPSTNEKEYLFDYEVQPGYIYKAVKI